MRTRFATTAGRLTGTLSRLLGRGATSAPGVVGLRLDPQLIERLSSELEGIIVVTGTNGKTTTSRFIGSLLEANDREYVHNQAGSNLLRGIAASLLQHQRAGRWGLFEVDEATMPEACRRLQPNVVIVTNLFRDQLDRYGELKRTADYIKTGLAALPPSSTVLLNADDPLVASLGQGLKQHVRYFGIEDTAVGGTELPHAADSLTAPDGSLLEYSRVYVGHLGHYRASDYKRPEPQVAATNIKLNALTGSHFTVGKTQLELSLPGLYNVYNALAAAAVGGALKLPPKSVQRAIKDTAAAFGRVETVKVGDRAVFLGLIKNPTGANELIATLALTPEPKRFLILINDNFADGRDVSWLWDADFERLIPAAKHIVVGGTRAADMALRLKYAGLPSDQLTIADTIPTALEEALRQASAGDTLYVLPTYTAMLELRQELARTGHVEHFLR